MSPRACFCRLGLAPLPCIINDLEYSPCEPGLTHECAYAMYIAYIFSGKEGDVMRSWSITEARAKISDVFDAALTAGPQKIERRDSEPVVIVAESDWNRLVTEYQTVADLVLNAPIAEGDMRERQPARVITREPF